MSSRPAHAARSGETPVFRLERHHPLRQSHGLLFTTLLILLTLAVTPRAQAASPYFTLSTDKTFAPTAKPTLHLYTRNESELEFRIYKVRDEEKFLAGLSEMHSFGDAEATSVTEDIDEETSLERFHDWKADLRYAIRSFFRRQLSSDTRDALRAKQTSAAHRSRIVGVAQFAQIPLLNDKQLVARWRQEVPPTFVSDKQPLPIDPLPAGMYLVEATDGHLKAYTLLMVSQTALITRTVAGQVLAFVVDRNTGEPVPNAKLTLAFGKEPPMHLTAGADGTAVFTAAQAKPKTPAKTELAQDATAEPDADQDADPSTDASASRQWVLARSGENIALVAPWSRVFHTVSTDEYTAYTYTDRPVYRPGHTVHFKSVLRTRSGDSLKLPSLREAHIAITDTDSKTLFEDDLPVSSFGAVEGSFALPANAALGGDTITVSSSDYNDDRTFGTGDFLVEDYRKPDYQVRVSVAKPRVLEGDGNTATLEARYFFGEPVAGAKVKYRIFESPHYWYGDPSDPDTADENAPGLTASASGEGGEGSDADTPSSNDDSSAGDQNEEKTGKTGPDGKLTVPIPTRFQADDHTDKDMVVEAAVTDPAGREITGRYRFLATYGSFRMHIESPSYFVRQNDSAELDLSALDYDNKPVHTPVHVRVFKHKVNSDGTFTDTPVADADATTDASGKAVLHLPLHATGYLTVRATALTPEHRTLQEDSSLYVVAPDTDSGLDESSGAQTATLLADKKTYAPGDTAHLTLISKVAGFHALVMATGYQQEFRKVLTATGSTLSFDVPITRDSQPNLTVEAFFLQDEVEYTARKSLNVPPTQQQLQITVTPAQDTFQPGQSALYDVLARDYAGRPVSADLSFGVVDEAIYSLHPDTSGDIVRHFYPRREVESDVESSLTYYFTGEAGLRSPLLAERRSRYRPQLAQVKPGNNVVQPKVRKDFPDTAFWQPSVHTDAAGHARVSLNFPDSLTTWRATVRAATAGSEFGSTVNRVLVRKNILVRIGLPRFLRKGDTATVPVIVHNYLPDAKQITLSLEAAGVDILNNAPQQVTVPSRGEATVLYHLRASAIGAATLTAKALSTGESDALQLSIPVQPSGVQQTLPDSGVLYNTADGVKTVVFPANSDPAAHTLTVTVSPTIAGSLFSALDYLTTFPYGCTEQTMSSFLPNVIVGEAMTRLGIPPGRGDPAAFKAQLDAKVAAGLQRLTDYHHPDGGWGWWKEDASQVFMTAYVISGLAQAAKAGYPNARPLSEGGVDFLKKQLADHPRMKPELRAYVVYALAEAGTVDSKQLDTLYSRRSDLSPQALAYTGLALLDAHDTRLADTAHLLESKAHLEGDYASWPTGRNELLDIDATADAESTAFALKFLVHADPASGLLPRAAQWLAAQRTEGMWWGSTQQTAFVLYGLTDYLAATHELDADLDVTVLVNNTPAAHRHFTHADVLKGNALSLTLDSNKDPGKLSPEANAVRIVTRGHGRAYWSTQGRFFSTDKHAYQRGNMTLNIARDYLTLVPTTDAANHLTYDLKPLSGPVAVGDVLAIHLGVTGTAQKYLLIEDPIPAGVEFVSNTSSYNINHAPRGWDFWYTRQELHDDRAALFSTYFEGRHDSFYLVRVTNAGSFAISPARVQPMYQPAIQATTDELHLDVKEPQP